MKTAICNKKVSKIIEYYLSKQCRKLLVRISPSCFWKNLLLNLADNSRSLLNSPDDEDNDVFKLFLWIIQLSLFPIFFSELVRKAFWFVSFF